MSTARIKKNLKVTMHVPGTPAPAPLIPLPANDADMKPQWWERKLPPPIVRLSSEPVKRGWSPKIRVTPEPTPRPPVLKSPHGYARISPQTQYQKLEVEDIQLLELYGLNNEERAAVIMRNKINKAQEPPKDSTCCCTIM